MISINRKKNGEEKKNDVQFILDNKQMFINVGIHT
jgi:hypothetical protein